MLIARACHGACTLRPDQFDFFAALNRSTAQPLNCSNVQLLTCSSSFCNLLLLRGNNIAKAFFLEKTTSYPGSVLAKTIKVRK